MRDQNQQLNMELEFEELERDLDPVSLCTSIGDLSGTASCTQEWHLSCNC